MTDLEAYTKLFALTGLKPTILEGENKLGVKVTRLVLDEESGKWNGWHGFFHDFVFNANGELVQQGAWE